MQLALEIKQLKKIIDEFQLGPVNLSFERGTVTALVGKNGAGKSTFLKLLMNLAAEDEGEIKLFDRAMNKIEIDWKKQIAYQPQTLIGVDVFNGRELMELVSKWYPTWNQDMFHKLIDIFEIPLNKRYGNLSPGVQKKLSVALTLARDTEILILDEPTAHMDIPAKKLLIDVIVDWMESGEKTVILATHQLEDIQKLADYIAIFNGGQIAGRFELTGQYHRFLIREPLICELVPGEIKREGRHTIISNSPEKTTEFLETKNIKWDKMEPLQLDEIISLMA